MLQSVLDKKMRKRSPQDMKEYPPSISQNEVEKAIDNHCGCSGNIVCNCVSVFNEAKRELWGKHNSNNG